VRARSFISLVLGLAAGDAVAAGSLLLISIDGLPPGYVTEASRHERAIPNLRGFVERGSYASGVVGVTPTVTYPSHTTMMTGVSPAEHGIASNTTFDPLQVNRDGWYWYAEDIKVPTLWSAAKAAGLRTAAVNWPVTVGDRNIDFLLPEYWRTSTADDAKLLRAMARPEGYLERLEKRLDAPFVDGNMDTLESDRVRTRFALEILRGERPHLMAVHLVALDGIEHREGPFTPAAFQVLEEIDGMVGELIAAARINDPGVTVAVVSDHGFITTHSTVNLRAPFVKAGLLRLTVDAPDAAPRIASWDAQVWPAGASAGIVLRDPKDAALRRRTRELLEALAAVPAHGIARVLDEQELRRAGAFPGAAFGVEFAPGFYFGAALHGALVTPGMSKGTHGYLPERPEMHASFLIIGPGIAAGRSLGVVDMKRVAPTLAKILKVKIASSLPPLEPYDEHR
jgi:predicted AlkP superfamily pyrophosphatase or phosphodiesterase